MAVGRGTSVDVDLPITLDRAGPPLPVQLADAVRDLIGRGMLLPGERLPASRRLADGLGVSRGTVVAGWDQLIAEGYLTAAQGSGTVVRSTVGLMLITTIQPSGARMTTATRIIAA